MKPMEGEADKVSRLTARIHSFLKLKGKELARSLSHDLTSNKLAKAKGPDIGDWDGLVGIMVEGLREVTVAGARRAATQAKANRALVHQADVKASEWAEDRAAEMVGMRWVDGVLVENPNAEWVITDTTRDALRQLVDQAIEDGFTAPQLSEAIEQSEQFSEYRANMIARTELSLAHNEANLIGWQESGQVQSKYSILSDDHQGEDVCDLNAEAGEVGIDEPFPSGDMTKPFHPNCLLPDTKVAAPGVTAYMGRPYEGKVVGILVGGVVKLTVTPNHPILTPSGWVSAGQLKKGDYLLEARDPSAAVAFMNPQDHQVQARIEDLTRAAFVTRRMAARRVPGSPEAFHGDGAIDHEVNVVPVDRHFSAYFSKPLEFLEYGFFTARHWAGIFLAVQRTLADSFIGLLAPAHGIVGGGSNTATFSLGKTGHPQSGGTLEVPHDQPQALEALTDGPGMDADLFGKIHAGLAGQVTAVQVSDIRISELFSGHVYNLQTKGGWYFAGGIIAHNCSCAVVAVLKDLETGDTEETDQEDSGDEG